MNDPHRTSPASQPPQGEPQPRESFTQVDIRRAYRQRDDVLFDKLMSDLTRQFAESRQQNNDYHRQVNELCARRNEAESKLAEERQEVELLKNEIQAIIAPAEVGGGIVAHLKQQLAESRRISEARKSLALKTAQERNTLRQEVERLKDVIDSHVISNRRLTDIINDSKSLLHPEEQSWANLVDGIRITMKAYWQYKNRVAELESQLTALQAAQKEARREIDQVRHALGIAYGESGDMTTAEYAALVRDQRNTARAEIERLKQGEFTTEEFKTIRDKYGVPYLSWSHYIVAHSEERAEKAEDAREAAEQQRDQLQAEIEKLRSRLPDEKERA